MGPRGQGKEGKKGGRLADHEIVLAHCRKQPWGKYWQGDNAHQPVRFCDGGGATARAGLIGGVLRFCCHGVLRFCCHGRMTLSHSSRVPMIVMAIANGMKK